jgi:hypothetical protein
LGPDETIECLFGDVSEWWVAEVVRQSGCLREIRVESPEGRGFVRLFTEEFLRHTPRKLADLDRVGEPIVLLTSSFFAVRDDFLMPLWRSGSVD